MKEHIKSYRWKYSHVLRMVLLCSCEWTLANDPSCRSAPLYIAAMSPYRIPPHSPPTHHPLRARFPHQSTLWTPSLVPDVLPRDSRCNRCTFLVIKCNYALSLLLTDAHPVCSINGLKIFSQGRVKALCVTFREFVDCLFKPAIITHSDRAPIMYLIELVPNRLNLKFINSSIGCFGAVLVCEIMSMRI